MRLNTYAFSTIDIYVCYTHHFDFLLLRRMHMRNLHECMVHNSSNLDALYTRILNTQIHLERRMRYLMSVCTSSLQPFSARSSGAAKIAMATLLALLLLMGWGGSSQVDNSLSFRVHMS